MSRVAMRWQSLLAVSSAILPSGLGCGSSSTTTAPVAPVQYTATLNAANERQTNPVNSPATGTATLSLMGDTLTFAITAAGLTARVTASHIHVGATTVSGSVVHGFPTNAVTNGTVASGSILLSTLVVGPAQISGDSLRKLLDSGNAYVNVHTSANLAGEIRGQIVRQ